MAHLWPANPPYSPLPPSLVLQVALAGIVAYIAAPTLQLYLYTWNPFQLLQRNPERDMLSLRRRNKPGRYTVGLTNRANDCFANSNLQALAAVPGLYLYLVQYGYLIPEGNASGRKQGELGPLTKALAAMVRALNKPVLAPEALSPWQLLVVLERIYKSRISRSQHDAHELLHLILETLQTENDRLRKALDQTAAKIPEFPFNGATIDRITCSRCGYCPPATPSTFLVLSLMVPQRRSAALGDLLAQLSTPEFIKDYGCTNCRLQAYLRANSQFDERLRPYLGRPWDLPEALERQVAGWPRHVTSPIAKSTAFHRLPQVLALHLSRSIYGGFGASRNSCKVAVSEHLHLYEEEVRYKSPPPAPASPGASVSSSPTASSHSSASSGQSLKSNSSATSMADTATTTHTNIARKKVTYRLCALIRHKGTHQTGHYECFRRKDLKWWAAVYEGSHAELTQQKSPATVPDIVEPRPASASASSAALGNLPYPGRCSPSPASVSASDIATTYHNKASSSATIVKAMNDAAESRPAPASGGREWWKISDEKVWECSTKDVLKEESGAYLLFYERV